MDPIEIILLIHEIRHRELLREAEKERLYKSTINKHSGNRSLGMNFFGWMRSQRVKNGKRIDVSLEGHRISDPCCIAGDTGK